MAPAFEFKPGEGAAFGTKRFHVRTLRPSDVDDVYLSWWNDAEIQAGFNQRARRWDLRRAVQHVKTFDNRASFHFGIFSKDTGRKVGFYTIHTTSEKVAATTVCIGDRALWGTDAVFEVKVMALDFIFNVLEMEKAETRVYGRNYASIFNSKAMGYTAEAVLRQHARSPIGTFVDIYIFGLLKDEWEAFKRDKRDAIGIRAGA